MASNYADVLESYIIYDIAEEGFGEAIKKAGKSIVGFIMKVIEGIRNLIRKLTGRPSVAEEKATKMARKNFALASYSMANLMTIDTANNLIVTMLQSLIKKDAVGVYDAIDKINNELFNDKFIDTSKKIETLINEGARLPNDSVKKLTSLCEKGIKTLITTQSILSSNSEAMPSEVYNTISKTLIAITKMKNLIEKSI